MLAASGGAVRLRTLRDPASAKTWRSRCEAAVVHVSQGLPGQLKESTRHETDATAAAVWAEKEEWRRLKKGWLLVDPDAAPGTPRMLRYLGRGYTGALCAADVEGRLLCNLSGEHRPGDELFLIDADAQRSALPPFVPGALAWKARYIASLQRLLVQADHRIVAWQSGADHFDALSAPNATPVNCLGVAGTRAVWYAEPELVVTDLAEGRELLRERVECEIHGGHSPQMEAALSADGRHLAYCAKPGEIVLIEVAGGRELARLTGGFAMITRLEFSADARHLVAHEQYGEWRLLCVDLERACLRGDWPTFAQMHRGDFAFAPDGGRLAVAQGEWIELFEWATMTSALRFRADHVVKRGAIAWVGGRLAMQTDYGCAGLYEVGGAPASAPVG